MQYWQIAAGSQGRDYAKDFLRFGMAFVGGPQQMSKMAEVEVGDRVLLKRGMSHIMAVGEVVQRDGKHRGENDKKWLMDFDGWELPSYCFVDWHQPEKVIVQKGLTRATIQNVGNQQLRDVADKVIVDVPVNKKLDPEPVETSLVDDQTIIEDLIRQGLRPGAAEELISTFNRIRLLARYYYRRRWEDVREHETRTFLVIPLLLALGWAEQQIKIELPVKNRGRADIACFSQPFWRRSGECVLNVETKGFSQGLDYAPNQAKRYAEQFENCRVVVVSNGYCYKAWSRQGSEWSVGTPSGYLNLLEPRDRYPLDPGNVPSCLEVLKLLLPNSWAEAG